MLSSIKISQYPFWAGSNTLNNILLFHFVKYYFTHFTFQPNLGSVLSSFFSILGNLGSPLGSFFSTLGSIRRRILCIAIDVDTESDLHITELPLTQAIFPHGFHQLRNAAAPRLNQIFIKNAWASARFRILEYPSFILSSVTPDMRPPGEVISSRSS